MTSNTPRFCHFYLNLITRPPFFFVIQIVEIYFIYFFCNKYCNPHVVIYTHITVKLQHLLLLQLLRLYGSACMTTSTATYSTATNNNNNSLSKTTTTKNANEQTCYSFFFIAFDTATMQCATRCTQCLRRRHRQLRRPFITKAATAPPYDSTLFVHRESLLMSSFTKHFSRAWPRLSMQRAYEPWNFYVNT